MKKYRQKGVSLVSLVIAIIVLIILAGIGAAMSYNSIKNAGRADFFSEVSTIAEQSAEMRLNNQIYGTGETIENRGFYKTKIANPPESFVSFGEDEIYGYVIDLDFVDYIDKAKRGFDYKRFASTPEANKVEFGVDDVYIYDKEGKVYYVKGYLGNEDNEIYYTNGDAEIQCPDITSITQTLSADKKSVTLTITVERKGNGAASVIVEDKPATQTNTTDKTDTFEIEVYENKTYKVVATEEKEGTTVAAAEVTQIEATTYKITYNANGGSNAPAIDTKTENIPLFLSKEQPEKAGMEFKGWSENPAATVATYKTGARFDQDKDTTLYAVWSPDTNKKYSVTYNANGGQNGPLNDTELEAGEYTISEKVPTKPDHGFAGWSTDPKTGNVTYTAGEKINLTENLILYAVWTKGTKTLTVTTNPPAAGTTTGSGAKAIGGIVYISTTPNSGYTFKNWTVKSGGITIANATSPSTTFTMPNADVEIIANYDSSAFTVKYDGNKGSAITKTESVKAGENIIITTLTPIRTGYDFQGWALTPNAEAPTHTAGQNYTVNSNIIFYAVWKSHINTYTVTYNLNTGAGNMAGEIGIFIPQTKTEGQALTLIKGNENEPYKDGYAFKGWSLAENIDDVVLQPGEKYYKDENITLYAVWKDETPPTITLTPCQEANSEQTKLKADIHDEGLVAGYAWTKTPDEPSTWETKDTGNKDFKTETTITEKGRHYFWAKDQAGNISVQNIMIYEITYDTNGGTGAPNTQYQAENLELTLSTKTPTKTGYIFLGWTTSSTPGNTEASVEYQKGGKLKQNADLKLNAVWGETYFNLSANTATSEIDGNSVNITITKSQYTGTITPKSEDPEIASATIKNNTITITPGTKVGTTKITITEANTNYQKEITVTINKGQRKITIDNSEKTFIYGDQPKTLNFTHTGKDSQNTTPTSNKNVATATVTGKTITITPQNCGTATITLKIAEDDQYKEKTVEIPVTVNRKTITVTPNDKQNKTYDGTNTTPTLAYTYVGNVGGETPGFDGKLSRKDGVNVGKYEITIGDLKLKNNGEKFKETNYTLKLNTTPVYFEITPKKITPPTALTPQTYSGTTKTAIANSTEYIRGGNYTGIDVGTYEATATLADLTNYIWSDTEGTEEKTYSWQITPKIIEVTWGTTTSFIYNEKAQGPTATATSGVTGETLQITRTTETNVGEYTSKATLTGVTGGRGKAMNYTLTNIEKAYKITEATMTGSITIKGTNRYNETLTVDISKITPTADNLTYQWYTSENGQTIGGKPIENQTNPTYKITADKADKYIYVEVTATKANYYTKIYKDITDDTQNTAGKVDRIGITAPTATNKIYTGTEQTGVPTGTTYTLSGAPKAIDAATYTVTATLNPGYKWSDGKLEPKTYTWKIEPKQIEISWGTTSFIYNGKAQGPTATAASGVTGETIKITRTTATNVGTYTSQVTFQSVEGGQANKSNYTLTNTSKAYTITPATMDGSITIKGTNKYGRTLVVETTNITPTADKLTYQWYTSENGQTTGGSPIKNATTSSYKITSAVAGKYIYVEVTATKANYTTKTYKDITDDTENESATAQRLVATAPTAQNYTYDGGEKVGVATGNGYTLSGTPKATNAGNYNVTATLNDGYEWEGGGLEAKALTWEIAKANFKCNISIDGGYTVFDTLTIDTSKITPTPTAMTYQWFYIINGETTMRDITGATSTSYTIEAKYADCVIGIKVTPTKENYNTRTYSIRRSTLIQHAKIAVPVATNTTYNGAEQTGVPEGIGYTLSGTPKAKDAGTYTVTATPNQGYKWDDGTRDTKTLTWTIKTNQMSGSITIKGTNTVGQTLTVNTSGITPAADKPEYRWCYQNSANAEEMTVITNQTASSLVITPNLAGKYITVLVTVSKTNYVTKTYEATTSTAVAYLTAIVPTAQNYTYDGKEKTGILLGTGYSLSGIATATNAGNYNVTATLSAGYRWNDGTLQAKPYTWKINPATITGNITITGKNTYGQTLTVNTTAIVPQDATLKYQWYHCSNGQTTGGTAIGGATTSSYKITSDVAGEYIYIDVTATRANYETRTLTDITDATTNTTAQAQRLIATAPTAQNDTYNGVEKVGVAPGTGYTLSGTTKATNAGTYTATATLNDGYQWSDDGTTTSRSYTWTISKATLGGSITITGTNTVGQTLTVNTTGITPAADNTTYQWYYKDTLTEFTSYRKIVGATQKTYTIQETYAGKYIYVVATATKANYETKTYQADLSTATSYNQIAVPTPKTPTYNGAEQIGVPEGTGYTLSGTTKATNAGTYTATATPNTGYKWTDGTQDTKTITWTMKGAEMTGSITIVGTYKVGQTLSVDISKISPVADNLTYQWCYCEEFGSVFDLQSYKAIPNATQLTYKITSTYMNNYIAVKVTATKTNYETKTFTTGNHTLVSGLIAKRPTARNYTYDGEEHVGVQPGEGYTLSGTTKGTAVRSYMVTAQLIDGYQWNTGGTSEISITWRITTGNYEGEIKVTGENLAGKKLTLDMSEVTPTPTTYFTNWYYSEDGDTTNKTKIEDDITASSFGMRSYTSTTEMQYKYIHVKVEILGGANYNSRTEEIIINPGKCMHDITWTTEREPTCDVAGLKTGTCSKCDETFEQEIATLGHTYGEWVTTTAATCGQVGIKTATCTVCGNVATEEIPKTGSHNYVYSKTLSRPTCEDGGEEEYWCTNCGDTYTKSTSSYGHNYKPDNFYDKCTRCGAIKYW